MSWSVCLLVCWVFVSLPFVWLVVLWFCGVSAGCCVCASDASVVCDVTVVVVPSVAFRC